MDASKYPTEYSLVDVTYIDGTTTAFTMKASPKIARYLGGELRDNKCLTLLNDTDALIVPREQLRSVAIRALTSNTK